jgi:outer membrane receptor protein involved in Fe transport
VAGFVDDFYLASASTLDFLLYDMERAEVLRGPQGTSFGGNATGGACQYFTARPDPSGAAGRIKLGYGTFNDREHAD